MWHEMEEEEASSNERHVPCRMQHNDHVIFWDKNKSLQGSRHEPTSTWICLSCFFDFCTRVNHHFSPPFARIRFFPRMKQANLKLIPEVSPQFAVEKPLPPLVFCRRILVFHGKPPNSSPQQIIRSGEDGSSSK